MTGWSRIAADLLDPPEPQPRAWLTQARPEQLPPAGDWLIWLILAGRGAGKTRTGAEWVAEKALRHARCRVALVAETFAAGRDTMVEGESGLLSVLEPSELRGGAVDSAWNRSLGELFLANGSRCKIYSSEKPGQLRGPQHHFAWCDELAKFRDAHRGNTEDTTWSNLMLGLRLGEAPRCVVSTTPKPVKLLKGSSDKPGLVALPEVHVTTGSTYDNLDNLAPSFKAQILERYEGTRLGRQELHAELLDDVEGALWVRDMIEQHRVAPGYETGTAGGLVRVVVGVDPAVTATEDSDYTGIVTAGKGADGRAYVLADDTLRASPKGWASAAIAAYHTHHADRIVAEVNNGGDMVITTLAAVDATVPTTKLHASRGKRIRAEPVAALYERGLVSHVGAFFELEDQLCSWTPESPDSPDRLDALVWALSELMLDGGEITQADAADRRLVSGRRAR